MTFSRRTFLTGLGASGAALGMPGGAAGRSLYHDALIDIVFDSSPRMRGRIRIEPMPAYPVAPLPGLPDTAIGRALAYVGALVVEGAPAVSIRLGASHVLLDDTPEERHRRLDDLRNGLSRLHRETGISTGLRVVETGFDESEDTSIAAPPLSGLDLLCEIPAADLTRLTKSLAQMAAGHLAPTSPEAQQATRAAFLAWSWVDAVCAHPTADLPPSVRTTLAHSARGMLAILTWPAGFTTEDAHVLAKATSALDDFIAASRKTREEIVREQETVREMRAQPLTVSPDEPGTTVPNASSTPVSRPTSQPTPSQQPPAVTDRQVEDSLKRLFRRIPRPAADPLPSHLDPRKSHAI